MMRFNLTHVPNQYPGGTSKRYAVTDANGMPVGEVRMYQGAFDDLNFSVERPGAFQGVASGKMYDGKATKRLAEKLWECFGS